MFVRRCYLFVAEIVLTDFLFQQLLKMSFTVTIQLTDVAPPPPPRVGVVVLYSYRDDYYKILV